MIALITKDICDLSLMDYFAHYKADNGSQLTAFHDLIATLGFSFSDVAYDELIDGTHSVYLVEEPADEDDAEYDSSENDDTEYDASDEDDAEYDNTDDPEIAYDDADADTDTADIEAVTVEAEAYTEDEYANAA